LCRAGGGELEQIQKLGPRFGADHGAISGHEAGPGSRAERRPQAQSYGISTTLDVRRKPSYWSS
jgi:hypothetical protein